MPTTNLLLYYCLDLFYFDSRSIMWGCLWKHKQNQIDQLYLSVSWWIESLEDWISKYLYWQWPVVTVVLLPLNNNHSIMGNPMSFLMNNIICLSKGLANDCTYRIILMGLCLSLLIFCQTKSDSQHRFTNHPRQLFFSDM